MNTPHALSGTDRIPLSTPSLGGNEWTYIKECLDTNWVSSAGAFVTRFEREVADRSGVEFAVATSCGTAALHLALLVSGVKPNDEVLMPTMTFIASANAVRYVGAFPTFLDVDQDTWQLCPEKVREFLETSCDKVGAHYVNRETGRALTAVMPVHLLGHPCDMDPLLALAKEYGLEVIEDNAEGLGAKYKGRPTGSFGQSAAVSFNGNKIITAGGGGMVLTRNQELADRARYLSTQARDSAKEYLHGEVGYNYRLTNIAAALGVAQIERLTEYLEKKREIAERYKAGFDGVAGLTWQQEAQWAQSNWWLFALLIDPTHHQITNLELMERLGSDGIEARPLFCPLHRLKPFVDCGSGPIAIADQIYAQGLCLPSSIDLTSGQQERVIRAVRSHLRA